MKILSIIVLLGLVSCAQSPMAPVPHESRELASSKYLNDKLLRSINLSGIQILDSKGENAFPYQLMAGKKVSDKIAVALMEASGDDTLISSIFTVAKGASSFKNVYGFITQRIDTPETSTFRLNIVYEGKSGNLTLIDYDIVDASPRELKVVNGPSDELEKFKVVPEVSFFPI